MVRGRKPLTRATLVQRIAAVELQMLKCDDSVLKKQLQNIRARYWRQLQGLPQPDNNLPDDPIPTPSQCGSFGGDEENTQSFRALSFDAAQVQCANGVFTIRIPLKE